MAVVEGERQTSFLVAGDSSADEICQAMGEVMNDLAQSSWVHVGIATVDWEALRVQGPTDERES